ncbi:MAG: NAD(P)-dependent oxidoreductase [Lentisphaerae bacterium]|nr:NAD(P)-dependent oxidoreductase [Lentisphaerota bacterium]
MKKLLITGATGFIGRHSLATATAKGYDVYAVTIDKSPPVEKQVNWIHLDLFDYQEVRQKISEIGPSHLLHFAWYAEPGKYWTSVENIKWVQSSLELLTVFQQSGGKRVVFAGSCAEYDWNYGYCSESVTPLGPNTLYGVCKNSLQQIVTKFSAETGISSAWGRIFHLYGPFEHPRRLVPSIINSLLCGQDALCSHGEQIRDFMHVQDVADAFVALLDSDVHGSVNIASGNPVRIRDVVMAIASKLGAANLVRFGAIPVPENEPPLLLADVQRLNKEVGWKPSWDLDKGLSQTIGLYL